MEFKIGDIVQLKSGGPKMTVYGIFEGTVHMTSGTKEGMVHVQWFSGNPYELRSSAFLPAVLNKIEERD